MRSKLCQDGKYRILAKVVVPMGVQEITMFALANPRFHRTEAPMNDFENLNKRELFNVAKESVSLRGDTLPNGVVSDNWTNRQVVRAIKHVSMLFPEVT
jgi:hypothetical protein